MKWFKHETNARNDAKLDRVRMKYGMEGYGLYWYCLELIGASVEPHNLTFELEHDAELIAHRTGIHSERVQEMMAYMIEQGLFESSVVENKIIVTCMKMRVRADEYTLKVLRTLESNRLSQESISTVSRHGTDKVPSKRIEEKRRESIGRFTPPTIKEIAEYVQEKNYSVDAERFWNFYESKNWMVGKNKMKKWKSAVANWNSNGQSNPNQGYQGNEI